MAHGGVEQSAPLVKALRLRQYPHELCEAGLGGHVERLEHAQIGQPAADVIDRQIGALALNLRGQRDQLAVFHGARHLALEFAAVVVYGPRTFVFAAVVPQSIYRGDDNGETWSDEIYNQIMSLDLFDPDARFNIAMEDENSASFGQPAANMIIDEEAGAFLLTALSDLTSVRLVNVRADEEGQLSAGDTLGEWASLKAGDYLRVQAYFPEIIPTLAIEYTSAEGESCLRVITDSKLDGTPMLIKE